jgi:hypothetical protein
MSATQKPTTGGNQATSAGLALPDLPFKLTGSQAKTAFSIRANCEAMITGDGKRRIVAAQTVTDKDGAEKFIGAHWVCDQPEFLNECGFLTLTLGKFICPEHGAQLPKDGPKDECPCCFRRMKFQQVFEAATASRHFNNLTRKVLKELFVRAIVVTERHKNRAIHFHLVGILRGGADIRTGFDFKAFDAAKAARAKGKINHAAEIRYKLSASETLRAAWQMLREKLPGYGFGRAELTPIKKTGEAVACYVSKYIEKNICNRLADDKGKKLVRYIGDWKTTKKMEDGNLITMRGREVAKTHCLSPYKIRPNDFAWASKRATAWRGKARQTARLIGCQEPEHAAAALGPRWAFHLSVTWQARTRDDLSPFLIADAWILDRLADDLRAISKKRCPGWLEKYAEAENRIWRMDRDAEFLGEPGFFGGPLALLETEKRMAGAVEFTDADAAELLENFRKENAVERFVRISARIEREETAWREFERRQMLAGRN